MIGAWILLLWIVMLFAVIYYLRSGAFMQPFNLYGAFSGLKGALKGAWLFIQAHAWWTLLWYALLIFSFEIVTPPYFFDVESLIAVPIATYLKLHGLSLAWSLGAAYTIVFAAAGAVIAFHFLVMRKIL